MSYEIIFNYKLKDCNFDIDNVSSEPIYLENFIKTLNDDRIITLCNLLNISDEDMKYIRSCDDNSIITTDKFVNDYLYKYKDTPDNAMLLKEIFKISDLINEEKYIDSIIKSRKKNNSSNYTLNYNEWTNLRILLYPSLNEKVCKWENIINASNLNQWEIEETIKKYKLLDKQIVKKSRFEGLFCIIKIRNISINTLDFINLLKKAKYNKKERIFIIDCLTTEN